MGHGWQVGTISEAMWVLAKMAVTTNGPWLNLLSKFPVERAEKYLDTLVSSLCGQPQRGPSFCHYSQVWSLTEFWQSNRAWREFFGRLDPDEPVMGLLDALPAAHQAVVRKVAENRREDIGRHLLHKTDDIGAQALTDFDWSVKLVLGSDTVASLGVLPLADLSLSVGEHTVHIEASIAEVGRLLASLEAAHKAVMQFRL